jgi:hypothetical protein
MLARFALVAVATTLISCGGREASNAAEGTPPASTVSVSGTWGGQPIDARSAIALRASHVDRAQLLVILSNASESCDVAGSDSAHERLAFLVTVQNATQVPGIHVGAYSVDNSEAPADRNGFVVAVGARYVGAACGEPTAQALGGLVTFSEINDANVTGTFRFRFETGDQISGSFSAPVCAAADLTTQACLPRAP